MKSNRKQKGNEKSSPVLPAFGLAEEVLGQQVPAPQAAVPAGPGRLYDFADTLQHDAREEPAPEERPETWVTFSLAGEYFALPVSHVQEILRVNSITRVPHAPHPVRGVTNVRGKVLPVIDLKTRLGLGIVGNDDRTRILVVSSLGRLMGLLVDSVQQVVRIAPKAIQPAPQDVMTEQSDYISGVYQMQQDLVILLSVDRVLMIKDHNNGNGNRVSEETV